MKYEKNWRRDWKRCKNESNIIENMRGIERNVKINDKRERGVERDVNSNAR